MRFRDQLLFPIAMLAIVLSAPFLSGQDSGDYRPVELISPLETTIQPELKQLHIENPQVKFQVLVGPEGEMSDYLAVEATHYQLLEKGELKLQDARFKPATLDGTPTNGKITVIVTFFDPEQRAWKQGSGTAPVGGSVSDAVDRKFYQSNTERFVYQESNPTALDSPLNILETKFINVHPPEGTAAKGQVVVEYYVDHLGRIRLPQVLSSDDQYLSLSALMTLKETRFAPPIRNGIPTFVRVRQPFNFD